MIRSLKTVWCLLQGNERRRALAMLAMVVLMAAAETVGVLSIMPFLTVLGRPESIGENALLDRVYHEFAFDSAREFTFWLGGASMLVVVASSAFKTLTLHRLNRFVHFQRHLISSRLLSQYLHQPYEFFLERNPAVLAKNVLSEVDQLLANLLKPLAQMVAQGAVVLAMTALIIYYDPFAALTIMTVIGALYGAIYLIVRQRLSSIGSARQKAASSRHQACAEALGGIKELKVTHTATAYLETYGNASRQYSRHLAAADTLSQSPLYLVEAVGYSLLIGVALVLLHRAGDIGLVLPALGLYGFAAFRILPAAQVIYRGIAKLRYSTSALATLQEDLSMERERPPAAQPPMAPTREVRLESVCYAYPSRPDRPVLRDFDLVIGVNESVGIVGRSGAGKSTVMDMLLGLLRPQSGSFSVDGSPITADNVAAWQRALGYVPQHIYLADASVIENIALGLPPSAIDRAAVERAARAAQIHDFVVQELPAGYDTQVGDRGIRLSGGQRQRIGIARALYRDPPVLLFDEATSALDAETEESINEAIRSLSGKKTIVVIAHKESSLRFCNRVISL